MKITIDVPENTTRLLYQIQEDGWEKEPIPVTFDMIVCVCGNKITTETEIFSGP